MKKTNTKKQKSETISHFIGDITSLFLRDTTNFMLQIKNIDYRFTIKLANFLRLQYNPALVSFLLYFLLLLPDY